VATKAGVGTSHHHNPDVAGREAAEQALRNANVAKPDFVFMFASVGYDQRSLLRAVRMTTGGVPLTGCSAEGTISGNEADESNFSVVVMTIASDELRWRHGVATGLGADSRAAGKLIAQTLRTDLSSDAVGLFVFPDGLTVNFAYLVAGLEAHLSTDRFLPLWGGAAGDNFAWRQTYQYCDDDVVSDGVAFALLSGEVQPAWALSHGCIPIGSERTITRCRGNVIYEIDGKPVLEIIKEYVSDHALVDHWPQYVVTLALCFKAPGYMEDDEYIVRGMPSVNETDGSVTIQTEAFEGASVWMSSRDQEKITVGLDAMAERIRQQLGDNQPKLVFQFDCASRGKMMFREQEKLRLLSRFRQAVDPDVPWVGFYTYAEIGPVGKQNWQHNYSVVVLALN